MTSTKTFANTLAMRSTIDLSDIDVTFAKGSTIDLSDTDVTFANTLVRGSAIDLGDIESPSPTLWRGALTSMSPLPTL
jgi:hypothetical protein